MKGYGSLDQGDSSGNGKKVKSQMDGLDTKRKKGGMGLGRERKREREKKKHYKCFGLRKEKGGLSMIHNVQNDVTGRAGLVQVWWRNSRSSILDSSL